MSGGKYVETVHVKVVGSQVDAQMLTRASNQPPFANNLSLYSKVVRRFSSYSGQSSRAAGRITSAIVKEPCVVQSGRGGNGVQSAGFDGNGVGAVVDKDFDLAGKLR